MKSKFLITILSIASLATIMPIVAHQEIQVASHDKAQQIDAELDELAGEIYRAEVKKHNEEMTEAIKTLKRYAWLGLAAICLTKAFTADGHLEI